MWQLLAILYNNLPISPWNCIQVFGTVKWGDTSMSSLLDVRIKTANWPTLFKGLSNRVIRHLMQTSKEWQGWSRHTLSLGWHTLCFDCQLTGVLYRDERHPNQCQHSSPRNDCSRKSVGCRFGFFCSGLVLGICAGERQNHTIKQGQTLETLPRSHLEAPVV